MDPNHAMMPATPGEYLRATPLLRWLVASGTSTTAPRLQQKWVSLDAERYEWRDVPVVPAVPGD